MFAHWSIHERGVHILSRGNMAPDRFGTRENQKEVNCQAASDSAQTVHPVTTSSRML